MFAVVVVGGVYRHGKFLNKKKLVGYPGIIMFFCALAIESIDFHPDRRLQSQLCNYLIEERKLIKTNDWYRYIG